MRNEMYDKNTEKRQHLDARNETNAINLFGLAFLCGNADEKSTGAHRKRSVNVRSVFVESAEQARYSSTSGGLPRPEPGHGQPTPPYKTAAQRLINVNLYFRHFHIFPHPFESFILAQASGDNLRCAARSLCGV